MTNSCNNQEATVTRPTASRGGHLSLYPELRLGGSNIDAAKLVEESPLVLLGRRSCAMRIVAENLLRSLASHPVLVCFDDEEDEAFTGDQLAKVHGVANGAKLQFPAVFLAGRLLGGVEEMISTHIAGALIPMLKEANVLWL